jgi:2-methylisocitrate lyase-like PEP mutase family enzyme
MSVSEVADTLAMVCDRIEIPVIVDADNGYGNALNVQRTVRMFERAGASMIQLEDQSYPKRCGHLSGKSLISGSVMVGKIRAALDARKSDDTLIMARTDAIAVEGFSAALDRAEQYVEAGADVLFVEAPRDMAEMAKIIAQFGPRLPLLVNIVEGGKTPLLNCTQLQDIGYKIAIFPGGLVRAQTHATQSYFATLLSDGTTSNMLEQMADFNQLNQIIGTPELQALGKSYDPEEGNT